jgi:hypothetical protein
MDFEGYEPCGFISMDGYAKDEVNNFISSPVKPHVNSVPTRDNSTVTVPLKKFSWNVIRFKKR